MTMSDTARAAWIGAAATVVAAIIAAVVAWTVKPEPPVPPEPPERAKQREALLAYSKLTEVIRKHSLEYAWAYPNEMNALKAKGVKSDVADKQLRDALRQRIHTEGDLIATNSEMRRVFPQLKIDGMDWDAAINAGRQQYDLYLSAVAAIAATGGTPGADRRTAELREGYISRRLHIANLCISSMR